ncbi:MurR/RpiR family transcriptional regulator [Providencia sneebia]|uniref:DNA-binding transcriptional regulator HexR n=1 Tax=Providencia sneebia DSM 19967 TaxID=1141660 RepID=K8WA30_9GAMM|nr:MurR/RpiR family transcriptional regulator [Providencia sneebia]EKT57513.1 DNA-binding transcriptional regulator HexR [Providencia sneebia DSM 19967]
MNILEQMKNSLDVLSKSERKVAEVILDMPQRAIHLSIASLAQIAQVSEPTVNRFCRKMETKGFPDFKLRLAQNLANNKPYINRSVEENDTVNTYTYKIFESAMAGLDNVKHTLDITAINRTVDLLIQARRISFFGFGSSSVVAHDAMNKFFCFNIPVIYFDDIVMQRMACINSTEDDVIVLISQTGKTKTLVDLAKLARENDATVIAITSENSPLSQESTLSIIIDIPEDTGIYMPIVSRLAQLTVIDVLTTGFTLRRGEKFRDNLKRVKEALRNPRFDSE